MAADEKHEHHPVGMDELLQYRSAPLRRLMWSLAITLVGMAIEIAGGILTGSLALLSDAGHMFTHVFSLGISAVAVQLAGRQPCHHRTFGLLRAEVLAAYTNALFLFLVTAYIAYEAVLRLLNPVEVLTGEMLAVAFVGLVVNIASIRLLHGHGSNISVRSAVAHMMADALSSVAIVAGALVMAVTGWQWIDPLLSIGIAGVILVWAWGLFRDTVRILMELAPAHVNTDDVERFVAAEFPEIGELRQVRIWSVSEDVVVFSAVAVLAIDRGSADTTRLRESLARELKSRFGFTETTIELEASVPQADARPRHAGSAAASPGR